MANLVDLPRELRDMIYRYLFLGDMQPTVRKYPRNIPFCDAFGRSSGSQHISKEAYSVYLSSNNIVFDNSRAACVWLEHIAPYFCAQDELQDEQQDEQQEGHQEEQQEEEEEEQQEKEKGQQEGKQEEQRKEQPLHLTFDLRHDLKRPLAKNNSRKTDLKRLFHLLAPRTQLHLTILADAYFCRRLYRYGALDQTHGFASATPTPAPAIDSRRQAHRDYPQSGTNVSRIMASVVRTVEGTGCGYTDGAGSLHRCVSGPGAGHLAGGSVWKSGSTVHVDTHWGLKCYGVGCDAENCLLCFANGE